MGQLYSRVASASLKKESVAGTAVVPDVFFGLNEESITSQYPLEIAMPVAANRALNIRAVKKAIPAPAGAIKMNVEPKKFGHFLNGIFGGLSNGNYMPIVFRVSVGTITGTPQVGATLSQAVTLATAVLTAFTASTLDIKDQNAIDFNNANVVTGTNPDGTTFTTTPSAAFPAGVFAVAEVVTGGSSGFTATVLIATPNFLLVTSPNGEFTAGETLTGGTSLKKATLTAYKGTVYGHYGTLPKNSMPTYTLQFNYADSAVRFFGVRFMALDQLAQANNVMTADVKIMCQKEFRHAMVTAVTITGVGAKTITVDQTSGLVVGDTLKIFRPRTGAFIDFASVGVQTNTIASIPTELTFTVTGVYVALESGDLIVIAPQTATYDVGNELTWIGGSTGQISAVGGILATADFEDFTYVVDNQYEERHAATGSTLATRFPAAILQKGVVSKGTFKAYYKDESYMKLARANIAQAFKIATQGDLITGTTLYNELDFLFPNVQFDPFQTSISKDAVVEQAIPFTSYYDPTAALVASVLLVNTVSTY